MISEWPEPVRRARDLVMTHGWNATAYQIVNPGIDHWFKGVIGERQWCDRVLAGIICQLVEIAAPGCFRLCDRDLGRHGNGSSRD